jgi:hypothetical protein
VILSNGIPAVTNSGTIGECLAQHPRRRGRPIYDGSRADFAAIEDDLQFLMGQLARTPTRREQARNALVIILTTASDRSRWMPGT